MHDKKTWPKTSTNKKNTQGSLENYQFVFSVGQLFGLKTTSNIY